MSQRHLDGKVALVTGGSRGIGEAIVRRFAAEGAKVYFTYRASEGDAKKVLDSLSGQAVFFRCDGKNKSEVKETVDKVLEKESRIDILVNNAGIIRDNLFLSMTDAEWQEVLDTNVGSVFFFTKAVAKAMLLERRGRIVNVSSVVGERGGFGQTNYAASKGAINAFTKALAAELASKGITVNAVAPGMVATDMSEAARSAFGDKLKERIPAGYFAEPQDVASVVAYLASDEARYITGQIIVVDGGMSLLGRR